MEKSEAVAAENGGDVAGDAGRVGGIVVGNGGVTETEKEIAEKKEPIAAESNGVSEKKEKESSKGRKKKAGAGVGQKKKKLSSKVVGGGNRAVGDETMVVLTSDGGTTGCRLQVSNTKKPLFFYLNVAKRYIKQNNSVELSALGMAIPTVVTISEILKKDGWATEKKISTSTVTLKDEAKGRAIMKAKIEILLEKPKELERAKVSAAAKSLSHISEKKQSSESNGKLIEKKHQRETNETLTEKQDSQNTNMKLTEEKEASVHNGNPSLKNDICGSNGKVTDKENTDVALAVDGK